jgi:hypothetical protein
VPRVVNAVEKTNANNRKLVSITSGRTKAPWCCAVATMMAISMKALIEATPNNGEWNANSSSSGKTK